MLKLLSLCGVVSAAFAAAPGLAAVAPEVPAITGYGSVVYTTLRSCAQTAASEACDGRGTGQRVIQGDASGGAGVAGSTTFTGTGVGAGSSAFGSISFGAVGLPQIKAAATAAGDVRVNSNIYFYQTYTYTGADPIAFGLAGTVHVDGSTSDGATGQLPGGAVVYANLSIWDASQFPTLTDVDSFLDYGDYFDGSCGSAGLLGGGSVGQVLPGGEQTYGFATSSCAGGQLMLTSGEKVVVAGIMQFPVNRGGSIDATHTFDVTLDPALGERTLGTLRSTLAFTPSVPEPATWAMMVGGFGVIGAGLRARRTKGVAFA